MSWRNPNSIYQYIRMLLAYPLQGQEFYYYYYRDNFREYGDTFVKVVENAAKEFGWEVVRDLSIAARVRAKAKETPILVAELLPRWEFIADVLRLNYPVPKLLLYVNLARKLNSVYYWGWGERKRKAVDSVLNEKDVEWHTLQAIKYRNKFSQLLRTVHPRPRDKELEQIWGWVVRKREPPNDKIEAFDMISRGKVWGDNAVQLAIERRLPWEAVRSHVWPEDIDPELLREAAVKIMTGNDIALQAARLAQRLGGCTLAEIVRKKTVDYNAAARAALDLELCYPRHPILAEAFFEKARISRVYFNKMVTSLFRRREKSFSKSFSRPFSRVLALVDATCYSLKNNGIINVAQLLMMLRDVVDTVALFNAELYPYKIIEIPRNLKDYIDLINLMVLAENDSAVCDAIINFIRDMEATKDDLVLVFTDGRKCLGDEDTETLMEVARKTNVVTVIATPYPADMLLKPPYGSIVAVPGTDLDMVIAGASITVLQREIEGIVDKRVILDMLAL